MSDNHTTHFDGCECAIRRLREAEADAARWREIADALARIDAGGVFECPRCASSVGCDRNGRYRCARTPECRRNGKRLKSDWNNRALAAIARAAEGETK